jgi:hypothetical protein
MASSTPFDGTNFNTAAPDVGQPHGNDYQEHQATKKSIEFVNNKEHEAIASDPSASGGGGVHKNGSGVAYISSSAATNRPDGSTSLAANDIDKGRLWLDDTTTPPALKRWSGSAWVSAGTVVLKDDSFQAVDQAGTGLVPLIGANASDKPELPDGAVATTQAVDDNSTKVATTEYVESQIAEDAPSSALCKGWGDITSAGSINASYNIASVSRDSEGDYTVTWTNAFASANYAVLLTPVAVPNTDILTISPYDKTTGSVKVHIELSGIGDRDGAFNIAAFGD